MSNMGERLMALHTARVKRAESDVMQIAKETLAHLYKRLEEQELAHTRCNENQFMSLIGYKFISKLTLTDKFTVVTELVKLAKNEGICIIFRDIYDGNSFITGPKSLGKNWGDSSDVTIEINCDPNMCC